MSTHLEADIFNSKWSEEYDCVPLRLRSKMLHTKVSNVETDRNAEAVQVAKQPGDAIFAMTPGYNSYGGSDIGPDLTSLDNISSHSLDDSEESSLELSASGVVGGEKVNNMVDDVVHQVSSEVTVSAPRDCSLGLGSVRVKAGKVKHETIYEFDDDLDNVLLGERRRILISRKLEQSSGSSLLDQTKFKRISNSSKTANAISDVEKEEFDSIQHAPIAHFSDSPSSAHDHQETHYQFDRASFQLRASSTVAKCGSSGTQEINATNASSMASSVLPSISKVKDEPIDAITLCNESSSGTQNFLTSSEMLCVKSEPLSFDSMGDELDHLPLIERAKLLLPGAPILESVQPICVNRPLKRKRTATNSVETALEEDAPEILKVLIERGVLVDEMKLFGQEDLDGDLDDSLNEDGFTELEAVMSQLFTQRESFLNFSLLHSKGAKINYCLGCLLSLVEQTRFLRNRKWPVEWGWCRDLQSFIFVFHRHNRIVLERPEYGYATYFFELLSSVPAAWQIKRLVTALKLTNFGRVTLIENKPLVVGEDVSEGEARVLASYGWIPNTGLATMLNYCDRVYHDRKQEMDSSEWRSKIGKQLTNGYNGGNIVSISFLKKTDDPCLQEDENVQVKLEQ